MAGPRVANGGSEFDPFCEQAGPLACSLLFGFARGSVTTRAARSTSGC